MLRVFLMKLEPDFERLFKKGKTERAKGHSRVDNQIAGSRRAVQSDFLFLVSPITSRYSWREDWRERKMSLQQIVSINSFDSPLGYDNKGSVSIPIVLSFIHITYIR